METYADKLKVGLDLNSDDKTEVIAPIETKNSLSVNKITSQTIPFRTVQFYERHIYLPVFPETTYFILSYGCQWANVVFYHINNYRWESHGTIIFSENATENNPPVKVAIQTPLFAYELKITYPY